MKAKQNIELSDFEDQKAFYADQGAKNQAELNELKNQIAELKENEKRLQDDLGKFDQVMLLKRKFLL